MNEADEFKRYHLTGKKDVNNIIKSFGLSQVQKHTNDQESVSDSVHVDEIMYKDTEIKLVAEHLKQDTGPPKDIQTIRQRLRQKLLVLADGIMNCDNKSSLQELEKQLNSFY